MRHASSATASLSLYPSSLHFFSFLLPVSSIAGGLFPGTLAFPLPTMLRFYDSRSDEAHACHAYHSSYLDLHTPLFDLYFSLLSRLDRVFIIWGGIFSLIFPFCYAFVSAGCLLCYKGFRPNIPLFPSSFLLFLIPLFLFLFLPFPFPFSKLLTWYNRVPPLSSWRLFYPGV